MTLQTADGKPLETLQAAALHEARERAEAILGAARGRADRILADARLEADAVRERIRDGAEQRAQADERRRVSEAQAQAHARVLAAQRSVLMSATAAARRAAGELVGDPRYDALLTRLARDATQRLAAHGSVQLVAAPQGGLIALTQSRRLDYSLDACVERCLETMTSELEALWR